MEEHILGLYLKDRGYIKQVDLEATIKLQNKIHIPWASLCIEHHFLKPEDIETIEQVMEHKGQDFFATAVEFELLTLPQTEYLHTRRPESWMFFADALLLENRFSLSQVMTFLASYRQENAAKERDRQQDCLEAEAKASEQQEEPSHVARSADLFYHFA